MAVTATGTDTYKQLKEAVRLFFMNHNKSRFANAAMWFKMSFFFLSAIAGYGLLLTRGSVSFPLFITGYLLFILSATFFVVNVGHDASHRALFKNKRANAILSYSWNLIGISKQLWEIKHHHSHHVYTNIPHRDVDIAESLLIRLSPSYPYRAHYRYQHLYAPVLYLLFGIFVVFVRDFTLLFSNQLDTHSRRKLPHAFLLRLIGTKLVFLGVSYLIPVWVLPYHWWQILIVYLTCMAISGSLMLLVLVVPHINSDAALSNDDRAINNQNDWALLQIQCTVDSSVESRLLNWLSGGLNTHLVHHLFPHICHVHYIELTRVIRSVLDQKGFEYKQKSFLKSLSDHFRYLKQLGTKPLEGAINR